MNEQQLEVQALITLLSDGSIDIAPGLTVGQALQLLDKARAMILSIQIRQQPPTTNAEATA